MVPLETNCVIVDRNMGRTYESLQGLLEHTLDPIASDRSANKRFDKSVSTAPKPIHME